MGVDSASPERDDPRGISGACDFLSSYLGSLFLSWESPYEIYKKLLLKFKWLNDFNEPPDKRNIRDKGIFCVRSGVFFEQIVSIKDPCLKAGGSIYSCDDTI